MKFHLLIQFSLLLLIWLLTNQFVKPVTSSAYVRRFIKNQSLMQLNRVHNQLFYHQTHSSYRSTRRPLVLIPGTGGSQLFAKLDKPDVIHYYCVKKTEEYYSLWLNLEEIVPLVLACFLDNIRLVYNATSRTTSNSPGVDVKVFGFGDTSSIEYVDPSHIAATGYFNKMVDALVDVGYERGVDLRGAPYDFRRGPNEMSDFFAQFKKLIEDNHDQNGEMSSVLICHSMGCIITTDFLKAQSQEWKDKYVKSLITMGAPWGGSVKALKAFTSGDNLGVVLIPSLSIRLAERTFPGLTYLMPRKEFWPIDQVLMTEPEADYTVANMDTLFTRLNLTDAYEMYKDMLPYINDFSPPNVEIHCLHGYNVKTIEKLRYGKGFPDASPDIDNGPGDGTVNLNSLHGCLRWIDKQSQPIHYANFSGVEHMSTMSSKEVIAYVLKAIQD